MMTNFRKAFFLIILTLFTTCSKEKESPCDSDPCLNGGICRESDSESGFDCNCQEGYAGATCAQVIPKPCDNEPCQNEGTCVETEDGYTCECPEGFSGANCEVEDPSFCDSNPCQNGGTCTETEDGYTCECPEGFSGVNCEVEDPSFCDPNPCENGGTCTETEDGYTCECPEGFSGVNCEVEDPSFCDPNPCENGGTCTETEDGYTCECPEGFSGVNCEVEDPSFCDPNPCENGGTCTETEDGYTCECPEGFSGANCEVEDPSFCDSNPCQNGGTCTETEGGYTCECPEGFSGANCEVEDPSFCDPNPCQNGGTCTETEGGYTCECPEGFSGANCEVEDPSFCDPNPCQNGGTCTETEDGYTCQCPEGFSGANCEQVVFDVCSNTLIPNIGYAAFQNVDGGASFCSNPVIVRNLNDNGPESLREAIGSNRYIIFDESLRGGTINLNSDMNFNNISNLTIDGRDSNGQSLNITISNYTLRFEGPENLVLGYLSFIDNNAELDPSDNGFYLTDALAIRGRSGREPTFYLVHNTFINAGDGALDIIWRRGNNMWATVEANYFSCNNKTMLICSSPVPTNSNEGGASISGRYHVTMTRNFFEENQQRHPLMRFTDLHYFNNVIAEQGSGGQGVQISREGKALIEDNAMVSGSGGAFCGRSDLSTTVNTGRRFILIDNNAFNGIGAEVTEIGNVLLDGGSGIPFNVDNDSGTGFVSNALNIPYQYSSQSMNIAFMNQIVNDAGNR